MASGTGYRIGCDVGGTFTDLICVTPDGEVVLDKTPTTLDDQSVGVMNGVEQLGDRFGLSLSDFSRWQFDVPVLIGTSRDWFHVWAGPKVLFTTFSTELKLALPTDTTLASFDGTATFLCGQGGLALGYRWLFFAFELTLAEAIGTAHLASVGLAPPTHDTKISSFTIYPSVGVIAEF